MTPIRFFSSAADAPRARRPTDVVLFVASSFAIGVTTVLAPDPKERSAAATFIQSLPGLFGWFWEIVHVLAIAWGVALLVAALVGRGRRSLFRDQLLALVLATLGCLSWRETSRPWSTGSRPPILRRSSPPCRSRWSPRSS